MTLLSTCDKKCFFHSRKVLAYSSCQRFMLDLCMVVRSQHSDHARPTLYWAAHDFHAAKRTAVRRESDHGVILTFRLNGGCPLGCLEDNGNARSRASATPAWQSADLTGPTPSSAHGAVETTALYASQSEIPQRSNSHDRIASKSHRISLSTSEGSSSAAAVKRPQRSAVGSSAFSQ